jgi:hypothetical protein
MEMVWGVFQLQYILIYFYFYEWLKIQAIMQRNKVVPILYL